MKINNIIIPGDALLALQTLPSGSVSCCVTSPPYYGLRDYGVEGQIGREETPEQYVENLVAVFREVKRVLADNGTLWLNIGDSYWGQKGASGESSYAYQEERYKSGVSFSRPCSSTGVKGIIVPRQGRHPIIKRKDLIGIPWMLAFALRSDGWYLRQDIIWSKPNPMPESVHDRCTKNHEYIFLFTKKEKYYFDNRAIMEPAAYDGRKDTTAKTSPKYAGGGTGIIVHTFASSAHERWPNRIPARGYATKGGSTGLLAQRHGGNIATLPMRNKRSVWTVSTEPEKEAHFACFPQKLIVDCIKAGCPVNGIVLDPFMGSGTTAVVARKLNRSYVGVELNPEYIEIANRKLYRELGMWL